jgi:hypothetical protein
MTFNTKPINPSPANHQTMRRSAARSRPTRAWSMRSFERKGTASVVAVLMRLIPKTSDSRRQYGVR